jgi:antitoxin HicB
MSSNIKKVHALFYAMPDSLPPSEPVRDWLRRLTRTEMTEIGQDIRVVELQEIAMKKPNRHLGSTFDKFLHEQGIFDDVEKLATKKMIALQLQAHMDAGKISKTEMAKRINTSRSQLDRVLDPENTSVSLDTLERAALAIGRRLRISLEELPVS